jgi:hypothetical protein
MQTKDTAADIVAQLRSDGFALTLEGDKIIVTPAQKLTDSIRGLIRANKPAIYEALADGQDLPQADIGTIRPPGMTDRFLAASQALDRQIADQDLQQREGMARSATAEVLSLFAKSKPTPTDPHRFDSAPIPAPRPAPAAKPKPDDWFHVDAPWRPLAKAYYAHHVNCKACQSSGQGRGERCGTGAALWSVYLVHTEGATK